MRIVSMVPSATEILCALGLQSEIVGISHECDYPADIRNRPRVTGTTLGADLSSHEIDERVRASAASGHSLYVIQAKLLEELNPDLVITQEQCRVCAVDRDRAVCALESLNLSTDWLSLVGTDFSGLYRDIREVGSATARSFEAEQLVAELSGRLHFIAEQTSSARRPRVFCLSWFDPLMSAGNSIIQMVKQAGGDPVLGSAGEASSRISVEQLRGEEPEVIFLLPCSFSQNRTADEWRAIHHSFPWNEFPAVREGRVFALESSLFHRPGPRLVDGVELMAALIHPELSTFRADPDLWRKVA